MNLNDERLKNLIPQLYVTCSCPDKENDPENTECYDDILKICSNGIVSREPYRILNQHINGITCGGCTRTNQPYFKGLFPDGMVCSRDCEDKLIALARVSQFDAHNYRKLLLESWNIRILSAIGKKHNCRQHSTQAECTLATINFDELKNEVLQPDNSKKSRKRRAFLRQNTFRNPPQALYSYFDEISSGEKCAATKCSKNIYKESANVVHYERLNLNFCSKVCAGITRRLPKEGDFHYVRNYIMIKAFAYRFNMVINPHKILLNDTGESVNMEMLNAIDKNLQKGHKQMLFTKKVKKSSSYVISFNMQGLRHGAHTVRDYCKLKLPLIIGLQEVKSAPGTKLNKALDVRGYKLYQNNEDTAVLVREDIKVLFKGRIADLDLPHDLIRFKTLKGTVSFLNIYARNKKLRLDHLEICERLGRNAIIVGDFNAKHPEILPHTQKKIYNHNGLTLFRYLNGREVSMPDIVIHNKKTQNEWTHAVGQYWSQIDLIITPQNLESEVKEFVYEDDLVSAHRGITVYMTG
jgi:hypothetical protein